MSVKWIKYIKEQSRYTQTHNTCIFIVLTTSLSGNLYAYLTKTFPEAYLYYFLYLNLYEKADSRFTERTFNFHDILPAMYRSALLSQSSSKPYRTISVKDCTYNK